MDFQVLRTFSTDLPYMETLLSETEDSAWISNFSKEKIQQIKITGDNITISQEVSSQNSGMDFTANHDIIFTDYKNSDIKLLNQSGEIKPFSSVKPLLPRGIHVTRDNEVIVGVRERVKDDFYNVTKESQRAVMVFDMNGKQKQSYQYDNDGIRLFTVPYRIITNINQDILVIDSTSDQTGRVVCLDREGSVKFIYEGNPKINKDKDFNPSDCAITSVGHIIVSDFSSHALHVLSETGDRLFCKVTEDLGIVNPYTIGIDRKGQLWVGCMADTGKQTGAKIHIVKLL